MRIVGAFDVHRGQITFDYTDTATGEVSRGKIAPADRASLRSWLSRFEKDAELSFALEGCTGWRFVAEELARIGAEVHLAEPADTAKERGRKQRAKTDRTDARLLRELLLRDQVPESWIPPAHVLEVRAQVRLYKALSDERRAWTGRIRSTLFHQGVPALGCHLLGPDAEKHLERAELSASGRQLVEVALRQIGRLDEELSRMRQGLVFYGRRQHGCRSIQRHFGIGALLSVAIWEELGDCRRFRSSSDAVRHSGLDITVFESDRHRQGGHLARQGPSVLRWALYEAAMSAAKRTSPDHDYFVAASSRIGPSRAALCVARKLARRCYHSLRELGDEAMAPAA